MGNLGGQRALEIVDRDIGHIGIAQVRREGDDAVWLPKLVG
jgi:hypothetical protein